jgi:hypothetical protein
LPSNKCVSLVWWMVEIGTSQTQIACFDRSIGPMLGNLAHQKLFRF